MLEKLVDVYNYSKREYNSERRRKLENTTTLSAEDTEVRENITPRGDGNHFG